MNKYIYRLGHCPDLSVAEFDSINQTISTDYNKTWIVSESNIDVNLTGSLVFGGEIIEELDDTMTDSDIIKRLENYLSSAELKQIGIFVPKGNYNQLFSMAKKHCKKVTINDKQPNFGHWKLTNNWIIVVHYKTQFLIVKLTSYSDQEFWSKLDMSLPCIDMSRGIINLKLGRTLCNLSSSKQIWDNFAGQGRIPLSAMDIKDGFVCSDNDPIVIPQINKNWDYATKYWSKTRFNKNITTQLATLDTPFVHDATEISNTECPAIVTEGYLGKNFKANPTLIDARKEGGYIESLWEKLLNNYKSSDINEIVGCLPFYPKIGFTPQYNKVFEHCNWTLTKLTNKHDIISYNRENSNVGHLIFRLVKKI